MINIEPDKLKKYKVVKSSTRNTKAYKDVAGGELCLLQQEVDMIELMRDKVMANDICADLINGSCYGTLKKVVEYLKQCEKVRECWRRLEKVG